MTDRADWPTVMETVPMSLGKAECLEMLRKMLTIREFDECAIQQRAAGKIYGPIHPCVGQEAVAVGICSALNISDHITSTHRGHGHCIAKGADVRRMMAELYGRVDGCCKGKGGSMHIADFGVGMLGANGIVAGGLPIAAGAALAALLADDGTVAAAFFGEGAFGEGEFHETMNIAAVWKLPLLLVCENNLYAANIDSRTMRVAADVSSFAPAYGMPGISIDGNDVLTVYRAARDAVIRARRGEGPTLIECKTFRWHFHAMNDTVPVETRPLAETVEWKQRDPIRRLVAFLETRGALTERELDEMHAKVKAEIQAAAEFADASAFPDPTDILTDMYTSAVDGVK